MFTVSPFLLPPVHDFQYPHSFMGEISVSEFDMFEALSSLDVSKASGPDSICAKILKHCGSSSTTSIYLLPEFISVLSSTGMASFEKINF